MTSSSSFFKLPPVGRLYVAVVSLAGIVVIARSAGDAGGSHPVLFAAFLCLTLVASIAKVNIPVPGSDSSLTTCHVIDCTTLIVCGPEAAVLVAAWGGWTQCTFRSTAKNPVHQVLFSVSSLGLTMWAAGVVYTWLGGEPGVWATAPRLDAYIGASTVVFLLNSLLVAGAVALTTRRSIPLTWFESFLSSWPSYMIGSAMALGCALALERGAYWLAPLLAGPLVLLHRNFTAYLERVSDATTDPLTGLYNQRYLREHLDREISRARGGGHPFSVFLLDLDAFKAINDRAGHAMGDKALRLVGERLKASIRLHDLAARYGGDEFVLVLADCEGRMAETRKEEIQQAIRSLTIDAGGKVRMPLKASVGIAVFPDDGDSIERLLAVADARMYQAKFQAKRRAGVARTA